MKKILPFLIVSILIGCGTKEKVEQTIDEKESTQTMAASVETTEQKKETEEVVEIPNQRTVDTGPNYPWQHFTGERIAELQDDGEIVYLFSDAEPLEQHVIEMINTEIPEYAPTTKEKVMESTASYLQQFIEGVSPYVDNEAYFNKLEEVKQAMLNGEYDRVPILIEEAKSLRESE